MSGQGSRVCMRVHVCAWGKGGDVLTADEAQGLGGKGGAPVPSSVILESGDYAYRAPTPHLFTQYKHRNMGLHACICTHIPTTVTSGRVF